MYELDILKVGKKESADAIAGRLTLPGGQTIAHIVIDAGRKEDDETGVAALERDGAPTVDLAIVTHPDGDHIDGIGVVFDHFHVKTDPKHPAGRVVNAYNRRGYPYFWTAAEPPCWASAARANWSVAAPGPILAELDDDA